MNLTRKLGIFAAAALVAGTAGAALAHPDADGDGKRVERIVIIRDGAGGEAHAEAGGERVRRFDLHRDGVALADCSGGDKIVDETAEAGGRKTKVIVCSKGAPSAATAQHLEEALARITANDDLSDEQKARIETALRSAIDRARGAR